MKHSHTRRAEHPFHWPDPPFHIVLVEPQIAPNTGNVARLCAGTGTQLHLVEPMGFKIDDAKLKRAGLDYWDSIQPVIHASFNAFLEKVAPPRFHLFSTGGAKSFFDVEFHPGDALVLGSETQGLSDELLKKYPDRVAGIPIQPQHVRSLNLSTAAGIVLYEALRQGQGNNRITR
jgi:tRNA (cytidine/uridine-2'-O-)-methyltransferase